MDKPLNKIGPHGQQQGRAVADTSAADIPTLERKLKKTRVGIVAVLVIWVIGTAGLMALAVALLF